MTSRDIVKGFTAKTQDFPDNFFGAVNSGHEEDAISAMREAAIPDGQVASPRALALMQTGEWDSKHLLKLAYIEAGACSGKIGKEEEYRFCGKPQNYCKIAAHAKTTTEPMKRGWYISLGTSQGLFCKPCLPAVQDGGPISNKGAARFLDPDNPIRLTKGQWKFIFDSWHATRVGTFSIDSEEGEEEIDFSSTASAEEPPLADDKQKPTNRRKAPPLIVADHIEEDIVNPVVNEATANESTNKADTLSQVEELQAIVRRNEDLLEQYIARFEAHTVATTRVQQTNADLVRQLAASNARLQEVEAGYQRQLRLTAEIRQANNSAFQAIQDRLREMALEDRAVGGGSGISQEQLDRFALIDSAVLSETGAVASLRKQFIAFKEAAESGGGIECQGITFRSKAEFLQWFDDKNPPVETFLDGIAYLHAIRAPVVHMDDASRQRESQVRTNISNTLQLAVETSFDTIIPSILVGGKHQGESLGGSYSWLTRYLKTYSVWKPVGSTNGVSHQILTGIPRVTHRVTDLRRQQNVHAEALALSTGLCHDSAYFCNELVRYISEQQEELTSRTAYTDDQVWSMQVECIQKIVEELSEARGGVSDAARFERGLYIWGMLKAWKVQQRYLENHFKNDPALTGIMVRRILMQGQDTSVKKQLDKVDTLERKIEEHNRHQTGEIKKLKEIVGNLKK